MSQEKDAIAAFINEMRQRNSDEIDAIDLPDGTREYVEERLQQGDVETVMFMLKLGYIMGLQTGYAAGQGGQQTPPSGSPWGPLEA